jgi:hypothetical protein
MKRWAIAATNTAHPLALSILGPEAEGAPGVCVTQPGTCRLVCCIPDWEWQGTACRCMVSQQPYTVVSCSSSCQLLSGMVDASCGCWPHIYACQHAALTSKVPPLYAVECCKQGVGQGIARIYWVSTNGSLVRAMVIHDCNWDSRQSPMQIRSLQMNATDGFKGTMSES